MKRLLVPIYLGELGWELINYVPHVQFLTRRFLPDEVHVVCRPGREALYPMGTHFYTVKVNDKNASGNSGGVQPARFNDLAKKLAARTDILKVVPSPKKGMRYYDRRIFPKYVAPANPRYKLGPNSVVLTVRGRSHHARLKNWAADKWVTLCNFLLKKKYTPVVTGLIETVRFEPPKGCVNLMGQTTLADMISLFHQAKFVVGQSTGPAHLASLCGTPHAIWGPDRIEGRYLKSWNPHRTIVAYEKCGKGFDCSIHNAIKLIDRLEGMIK